MATWLFPQCPLTTPRRRKAWRPARKMAVAAEGSDGQGGIGGNPGGLCRKPPGPISHAALGPSLGSRLAFGFILMGITQPESFFNFSQLNFCRRGIVSRTRRFGGEHAKVRDS